MRVLHVKFGIRKQIELIDFLREICMMKMERQAGYEDERVSAKHKIHYSSQNQHSRPESNRKTLSVRCKPKNIKIHKSELPFETEIEA